ncbi:MAG: site-2 protease family protein [Clostridia bacterium]|nr:site-2 protease family protein [Clostridia bacterium]
MNPVSIISLLLSIPGVFLTLAVHEYAHGWASYQLGDPTARNLGRLTLNPIKHIDPIGLLCMIFFRFGWARPVPVNARYYKKPRRDMALVAAAGPASNLVMMVLSMFLIHLSYFIYALATTQSYSFIYFLNLWEGNPTLLIPEEVGAKLMFLWFTFLMNFCLLNASLAVFNLLPIPPLDGSRIAFIFLPVKFYFGIMRYERIIQTIMFVLLFIGVFDKLLSSLTLALLNGTLWLVELIPIFKF